MNSNETFNIQSVPYQIRVSPRFNAKLRKYNSKNLVFSVCTLFILCLYNFF